MKQRVNLLDVVALTEDVPDRHVVRGQVGTVVEVLGDDVFEVEFTDDDGVTYAQFPVSAEKLIVLHYRPSRVA